MVGSSWYHSSTWQTNLVVLTCSIWSQITDVDEADNAVFRIEEDNEIIDVDT